MVVIVIVIVAIVIVIVVLIMVGVVNNHIKLYDKGKLISSKRKEKKWGGAS